MRNTILLVICSTLSECHPAMGHSNTAEINCVVDQCDQGTCSVETPEGWVSVPQEESFKEGKKIDCPIWLIDPI